MRVVLAVALLFACGTALEAQEPTRSGPVDSAPVFAPVLLPSAPAAVPAAADAETEGEEVVGADAVRALLTAPSGDAAAVLQDPPRNWWWLVGGIVLAGVVLAVLL